MNSTEVIARLKTLEPSLRARGVEALYLFGSVARGEAGSASDVDLMCDLSSNAHIGLLEFLSLGFELEDELGIKVDLSERQALRPRVRAFAEGEMMRVF